MTNDQLKEEWVKPSMVDLLAASGAAATATIIGGQLGVAGTVAGAAIASAVTTVALAAYKNLIRKAHAAATPITTAFISTPNTETVVMQPVPTGQKVASGGSADDSTPSGTLPPNRWGFLRKHWAWLLAGIALAAVVGLFTILTAERVSGQAFTPGTAQIQQHNDPKFPGPVTKPNTHTPVAPTLTRVATPRLSVKPSPTKTATPTSSQSSSPTPATSSTAAPMPSPKPS